MTVTVDGIAQPDGAVILVDDGLDHLVAVSVPAATDRADFEDLPISAARMAATASARLSAGHLLNEAMMNANDTETIDVIG